MSGDETFESKQVGGNLTFPTQAGALKKGDHLVINGHPCRVIEITVSKTGKHGHAKASITAIDIFTKQKLEDQAPTSHNVEAPVIKSVSYSLMDIASDGMLTLMDDENNTREDLCLPPDEELAAQIKESFDSGKEIQVIAVSALGKEQILSLKADNTR
eukprot:GILI01000629.1.p1 GENE.GILI01000629.1~~GILI01000629.1.p1  ORF type:complete len:158 (-),score=43.65 GILI01000629.1:51-524(-)